MDIPNHNMTALEEHPWDPGEQA